MTMPTIYAHLPMALRPIQRHGVTPTAAESLTLAILGAMESESLWAPCMTCAADVSAYRAYLHKIPGVFA